VDEIKELLNGPKYFHCEGLDCRLRVNICVARQKRNRLVKPFDPAPFLSCDHCEQGKENWESIIEYIESGNPKSGEGVKNEFCDSYGACLEKAALENWKTFNCESCGRDEEMKKEVSINSDGTRICEECHDKETISPKHALCSSCLGKKAHSKGKGSQKKVTGKSPKQAPIKAKSKKATGDTRKPETPPPASKDTVTIQFGKHVSILREVEKLADDEMRPIDLQIVYMLKRSLENMQNLGS